MENFINILMNFFVYAVPFVILYFVVAAGVRKGIDSSDTGRSILEKNYERKNNTRK